MTLVRIQANPDTPEFWVTFRYDADLVSILKDVVPTSGRRYSPESKHWTISALWIEEFKEAVAAAGHEIEGVTPRMKTLAPGEFFGTDDDGYDDASVAAGILDKIPAKYRGRVFRAMAKQLYPDLYRSKR